MVTTITTTAAFAATPVPATSPPAAAAPAAKHEITKKQAEKMALKAHPGKVTKAYEDTTRRYKTWEVKIKGDDGNKWEMYYEIATGELVAEEASNH